jgi:hypothetical protein
MRPSKLTRSTLIWCLIIAASPTFGSVKLIVRDGRPIVDGVYVNGHGPYRFLVDTGANVNLIEAGLARKIGMTAAYQVSLASAAGNTSTSGSDGNEVALDSVKAGRQKFLFCSLDAIHNSSPDVHGVLGQWFLAQFDYTLNLQARQLEFGKRDPTGPHSSFRMINARPVVATSLGDLALDSGQTLLVLFGVQTKDGSSYELRTVAGSQIVGKMSGKPLIIDGRRISDGEAVAIPSRPEPGVDGLLPLSMFKAIYICNSEGYVVFE